MQKLNVDTARKVTHKSRLRNKLQARQKIFWKVLEFIIAHV